jgi:hypothetical protein
MIYLVVTQHFVILTSFISHIFFGFVSSYALSQVNKLRDSIQSITRTTGPLSSCVDFVQEVLLSRVTLQNFVSAKAPAPAPFCAPHPSYVINQDLETMSREMDLWVRDAQVQQQRYDDERRKTDVELEPLLIKLQVCKISRTFLIYRASVSEVFLNSCLQIAREVTAEHRLQVASARAACARNEELLFQLLRKISNKH